MVVDILDGNEIVLEKRSFSQCHIKEIYLGELDYAATRTLQWIEIKAPTNMGNAIEEFKAKHPELEAIFLALNGLKFIWPVESHINLQTIHQIEVEYESLDIEYPELNY